VFRQREMAITRLINRQTLLCKAHFRLRLSAFTRYQRTVWRYDLDFSSNFFWSNQVFVALFSITRRLAGTQASRYSRSDCTFHCIWNRRLANKYGT